MLNHPDVINMLFRQRSQELIEQASTQRLAASLRLAATQPEEGRRPRPARRRREPAPAMRARAELGRRAES
jgi:hypothetical protein